MSDQEKTHAAVDLVRSRPQISITPGELSRAIDQTEQALIDAGAEIFAHDAKLMRVRTDGVLIPVTSIWLRDQMSRVAEFVSASGRTIDPPPAIAMHLLARVGEWKFRRIAP